MDAFRGMTVLRPHSMDKPYLVMSYWEGEQAFRAWTRSEASIEGHRPAFEELPLEKERGETAPIRSEVMTYLVLGR
jgi:heme oxygenase (mycobilin-producing)